MTYKINGRRAVRPGKSQKNPAHFEQLREQCRARQTGEGGLVYCGTCAETDGLEFHHRHYDNWGKEKLEDMVLLCRYCHEAITSRIRTVTLDRYNVAPSVETRAVPFRPLPKSRETLLAHEYKDERRIRR